MTDLGEPTERQTSTRSDSETGVQFEIRSHSVRRNLLSAVCCLLANGPLANDQLQQEQAQGNQNEQLMQRVELGG